MITHYLKVAFRSLLKYKTQNLIAILGLSVGLFCFCVCFYISRFVGSVDTCFENYERSADVYLTDEGGERWSGVSGHLLPHLQQRTWDGVEGFTLLSYPNNNEYNLIGENNEMVGETGTGFFLRCAGKNFLVTNHHVIERALVGGMVTVHFPEEVHPKNDAFTAEVLALDKINDVALLEVILPVPEKVTFLELADLTTLRQGEKVVTVGCPRHMKFNAVEGAVSNTCYEINPYSMNAILCTLQTTHGNSGGAIVRLRDGAVIGIATAIFGEYLPGHTVCASADAIRQLIYAYARGGN